MLRNFWKTLRAAVAGKKKDPFLTKDFLKKAISSGRAVVGKHTYGDIRLFGDISRLHIGNFCSIARGCQVFLGNNHRPDFVTTYPFSCIREEVYDWKAQSITGHPASRGNVVIGHDVWIGMNVTILSGVTIGSGAVIGANSLVVHDVEPYSIVGGNPAKHLRNRFDTDVVARLLALEWWNWSDEEVLEAIPHLMNADIQDFFSWCERRKDAPSRVSRENTSS